MHLPPDVNSFERRSALTVRLTSFGLTSFSRPQSEASDSLPSSSFGIAPSKFTIALLASSLACFQKR